MRAIIVLILFCLIPTSQASTIDVNNLIPASTYGSVRQSGFGRGQTFRMGRSGSLDRITLGVLNELQVPAQATLKLYQLTGREINQTPITSIATSSVIIRVGSTVEMYDFTFSGLTFPSGKKLAFGLYGEGINIGLGDAGLLASTPILIYDETIFFWAQHAVFATYVTPVPEPSAVVIAGLAGLLPEN